MPFASFILVVQRSILKLFLILCYLKEKVLDLGKAISDPFLLNRLTIHYGCLNALQSFVS